VLKKHVNVIAEALGKTVDGVKSKMRRLGLKEVDTAKKTMVSSSSDLKLELPEELLSIEKQLKVLAAALKAFSFLESLALEPEKGKGLRKLLRF
jgi:hypothetical protein